MDWAACSVGVSVSSHNVSRSIARHIVQLPFVGETCFEVDQKRPTFGVRSFSSSSVDALFLALGGAAVALSLFFSSLARCFWRFLSSVLLIG